MIMNLAMEKTGQNWIVLVGNVGACAPASITKEENGSLTVRVGHDLSAPFMAFNLASRCPDRIEKAFQNFSEGRQVSIKGNVTSRRMPVVAGGAR